MNFCGIQNIGELNPEMQITKILNIIILHIGKGYADFINMWDLLTFFFLFFYPWLNFVINWIWFFST